MLVWGDFYAVRDVVPPTSEFQLVQFNRPGKASLSYLVGSEGEALVVDANRVIEPYLDEARKRGLTIRHVLDTHVHADYISGGSQLARETGATYHISGICGYQGDLKTDGQPGEIRVGSIVAQKIHTPGHTPGSTSLLVDGKYLLTGDTLFVESVGRPDLGGQAEPWAKQLYGTLFGTLKDLPDGTQILPSHYANASELRDDDLVVGDLGSIRRENEGMQAKSEEEFIEFIRANMRPSPEHYGKIRQINMAVLSVCDGTLMELDLGKNECAASKGKG
jgi:glyoxylase-like metal-dependent hydrolase (beta-lactamase superfamily II)